MAELPDNLLGIDGADGPGSGRNRTADSDGERDSEEEIRAVLFRLGDYRFGIPVDDVRTTTDLQEDVTPVPRAADAIEGVVDLRGEITAVIDPSVHFPPAECDPDGEKLLVFERSAEQQAAAIRVDEVLRVEPVPESNLHDQDSVADSELSGDVLEHPLVDTLLELERRPRRRLDEQVVSPEPVDESDDGSDSLLDGTTGDPDDDEPVVESFELEDDGESDAATTDFDDDSTTSSQGFSPNDAATERIVIEGIPLIDVEKFLTASGHRVEAQRSFDTEHS
ncbi:chemotaxis protein CheW [Halobiforma nitratireducens]|uniref:Chemotaxis protein CheW n=1 Tax=Halobiforma nitratireducens JCM 10879 TaxID=1227454 RepID=M0MA04_9EURY|nr:chemotaxis protein CheW [Halobiforma nitratireducens]EMA42566.1 chemotaxis protein CheW [Halobiforma nitratireducens JCM 10879]